MKYKYSLIILNWKRPHNVIEIIHKLYDISFIDEIIISNGHPTSILTFTKFNKIMSLDDTRNNEYYGLDLRFITACRARNSKIIFMDDDILIDYANLIKLIIQYEKNPNRIVGIEGRNMEGENHYGKIPYKSQECDIVLTRLLVCDKMLCNLFFKCKPLLETIYRQGKPYGNGEDIVLSFVAKLYYNIHKHLVVNDVSIRNLPANNSINANGSHIPYRVELCRYLKQNRDLFNNVIHFNSNGIPNNKMYLNITPSNINELYQKKHISLGYRVRDRDSLRKRVQLERDKYKSN